MIRIWNRKLFACTMFNNEKKIKCIVVWLWWAQWFFEYGTGSNEHSPIHIRYVFVLCKWLNWGFITIFSSLISFVELEISYRENGNVFKIFLSNGWFKKVFRSGARWIISFMFSFNFGKFYNNHWRMYSICITVSIGKNYISNFNWSNFPISFLSWYTDSHHNESE